MESRVGMGFTPSRVVDIFLVGLFFACLVLFFFLWCYLLDFFSGL